jgi:superfamily II DNA or RNA helicase
MKSLTRSGYIVENNPDVKKELTVRPQVNNDFGFPPPSFKVFRQASKDYICVPQHYGRSKFGEPDVDKRPEPTKLNEGVVFSGKLRDETSQNEAFQKGVSQGCGVLSLPCGYGKTTVALAIAAKLGYRTIIIVHKEFLANQWRERIQQFCPGASIGLVQQNTIEVECDFIIVMLQSLSQKEYTFDTFEKIGTVIVDEAHHICARVFSQALFKLCPKHIYGLSATPDRKDGLTRVLNWFIGPLFFGIERENQKQIEVFPVPYHCKRFEDPPPCNRVGKVSLVEMITVLVEMESRNNMIIKLIKKASKGSRQLLVLSDRRLHCEFLHSQFPKTSGLYMGGMKEQQLLESSKKKIIFGTFSQAHEGLDIPTLDSLILATPKSDIKQSIGRIMRETVGKQNNPQIWDIRDQWSLLNAMFNKRKKVYITGGFKIDEPVIDKEDDKRQKTVDLFFKGKCLL